MTEPRTLTFMQRLALSELPRRILGAVIAVFVPGAGHVVLGYPKLGWTVAGITLSCVALAAVGVLLVIPPIFLVGGSLALLCPVVSVVSIFALPPGPYLKDGLRALWPVLVLFVLVRGLIWVTGAYILAIAPAPDDGMAPRIRKQDTLFVRPIHDPKVGDPIFFEHPAGAVQLRRVAAIRGDQLDVAADADESQLTIDRKEVRYRALFVLAAGTVDGRGRIWKPLER